MDNKIVNSMYGGEVELVFNPDAPRARYKVTDSAIEGREEESMRGVTTVLRDIINKPDLMMWPLNMAAGVLEENMGTPVTEELIKDAKGAHRKRSDRGKDIGSMAHRMIELYLLKSLDYQKVAEEFDADPKGEEFGAAQKAFTTFQSWWESLKNAEVLSLEAAVYSRSMSYAGTYDLLAKIDGKVYMIDVKTTNRSRTAPKGVYAEYFLQLGGYSFAAKEENNSTKIDGLVVVNVGKDGKLGIVSNEDLDISVEFCERAFEFALRVHDWIGPVGKRLKESSKTTSVMNPLGAQVESTEANK